MSWRDFIRWALPLTPIEKSPGSIFPVFDVDAKPSKSFIDTLRNIEEQEAKRRSWDTYYYGFAAHAATKSKDSTKVGAALIGLDGEVRLTSFNGPPKGVRDLPERFERPTKYLFAAHAERNLIAFAAREGIRTKGCTVYATHAPCSICAQVMIQAGIKHLVYGPGVFQGMDGEVAASKAMFADVGATLRPFVCDAPS